ncbi:ATP-binding protein [Pyxidicoccus sp. 3LFB2]
MLAHLRPDAPGSVGRPTWVGYALTLPCVGIAFTVQWLLSAWLAPTPFLLLLAGVLLAALLGGREPGWLATGVSALLAQAFFTESPVASQPITTLETLLFVAVGGLAASLVGTTRHPPVASAPGGDAGWLGTEGDLAATLLRSTADAMLATDADGQVRYLNPAAARLLACLEAEAVGRPLTQVLHLLRADTRERISPSVSPLHASAPSDAPPEQPRLLVRRDGTELPVEESIAPVLGPGGVVLGAVLVMRSAFERRRLEAERCELLEREHAALREAQFQRERMESLFQQAPVAISVFSGPEHRCELLNPHALELIAPEGPTIGRPLRDVLPHLNPGLLRLLDDVFHSGVPFSGRQVPFMLGPARDDASPEGLGRYFDVTWQPWRGADRAIQGIMAVAVEVTGLVNARRGAEAIAHELQQALQTRDEFLSIASHELKTPITSLQLQLELLLRSVTAYSSDTALHAVVRKRVEATLRPVARLQQLVATLLDVSRIRAGRLDMRHEPVDLSALVQDLVTRAQEDAALARCALRVEVETSLVGHWDPMRLEQVITNLLSNAFKYGAQRPVEVRAIRDEGYACLTVRDNGIGIAPEDHERIFQRFERAVSERHYGGFGLGLWIVRQILESLQGDIRVHSKPGEGATFIVRLPLDPAASAVA